MGRHVGLAVRVTDGVTDGDTVGPNVSPAVGVDVGDLVGNKDALADGLSDSAVVGGLTVGANVGGRVGLSDDDVDGEGCSGCPWAMSTVLLCVCGGGALSEFDAYQDVPIFVVTRRVYWLASLV